MQCTYENEILCLANYSTTYDYLVLEETCNALGKVFFEITFENKKEVFFTIDELMDYLLNLSNIQDHSPNKNVISDDIHELLTFIIKNQWKGDSYETY